MLRCVVRNRNVCFIPAYILIKIEFSLLYFETIPVVAVYRAIKICFVACGVRGRLHYLNGGARACQIPLIQRDIAAVMLAARGTEWTDLQLTILLARRYSRIKGLAERAYVPPGRINRGGVEIIAQ